MGKQKTKQEQSSSSVNVNTPRALPQIQDALNNNFDLFNQVNNQTAPDFALTPNFAPETEQA